LKIAILSRAPKNYSTSRLVAEARARKHTIRVLDTMRLTIDVEENSPTLHYKDKPLTPYHAVIPRVGASITFFGCAVVRQFEEIGSFCLNGSTAIATARDKLRSTQLLSRHGIGIPRTVFVRSRSEILPAIARVGGVPVVIKLLEGTQGVGVILAETENTAEAVITTLQTTNQNVLLQQFIAESRGRDVRAFVVGGKVIAAMRRVAQGDEFRSNVHRGADVEAIEIDPVYAQTAVRAAAIMGLNVAGVDMLEGNDGPQVMEVNSSPGLQGIERATGLNVAGEIIEYLERRASAHVLDVRHRLAMQSEYEIVEFRIHPDSPFVGKSIGDSGLRKKDVVVLCLNRDNDSIANPRADRELKEGDLLTCFGNSGNLQEILRPPSRRRKKVRT
jgi:ribosomal protein S6--L-glutamate ligase